MTATSAVPARSANLLKSLWTNLPALAGLNLGLAVALVPAGLLAAGGLMVLVPAAAFVPSAIAAAAISAARWDDGAMGRRELRAALRPGLRVGGTAGAILAVALATLQLYRGTGATWLLGPLFVDGAAVTLSAIAAGYAVPLALQLYRGRLLWTRALALAASDLPATASCLFMLGVTTALVLLIGPGLILLLPAPVLFVTHAIVREVIEKEHGD